MYRVPALAEIVCYMSTYIFIIYQRLKQLDIQRFGLLTEAFFRESGSTLDR